MEPSFAYWVKVRRRQIEPNPSLSRQQRRYAERLAAKRAKYSDVTRLTYRIPLPA